ncbi:putative apoptosis-inducing factor 1, mitochondrial [Bicyclus anynana]|uniref:Apoptosis-inducing factor 1, mitochondrial n=1 Tax=Bicyclus anynana TaxID=110368 RepID=A0ABM3LZR0_BICAN|nr:putative apoptosis-inducing factor 1, mitochondrial [Bicyclus anynana]
MLECACTKGPCSLKPVPDPPPCPPPPPPPFPWIYVWALLSFFGLMGTIYQLFLWKEYRDKIHSAIQKWRPRRKVKRPFHSDDLPACVQYLIIGTGAAGWAAYRAIMEHDKKAKVFFITKEDCLPYNRMPMSKHMWWNPAPPDMMTLNYIENWKRKTMYVAECKTFMDPITFYRKTSGPAASIASGWCVLRVDADDHVAWVKTICGEQPVYYERCLIAVGAKAKNLEIFKSAPKFVRERVQVMRSIRDLELAYRRVKAARHVVILGGGFLGSELAWYLARMSKEGEHIQHAEEEEPVQLVQVVKDKGILAGVVPEYLAEWATEKIKCEGVTVIPKTQVYDAFESPDGRLQLTLSNGSSIITDYVLVAVGTEPREELAEPSYLELDRVNGGFLVNTELEARTHLYVAGDAASIYSQWKDTRLRMEHYGNAEEQGYIAGANMTGYWIPCNMEPHFKFRLGDSLDVEGVGEVGACMPTVALFKPCGEESKPQVPEGQEKKGEDMPCFKKADEYKSRYKRGMLFYLRDETVVGMVFWNIPPVDDRYEAATEVLRARPSYKDINIIAGLFGFPETQCDYLSEAEKVDPAPCIQNWRFP